MCIKKRIYIVNIIAKLVIDDFFSEEVVYTCEGVRTPGYYSKLRDAKKCLEENWGNIHEYTYEYACIEEVKEGLHPIVGQKWWYKWDKEEQKYKEIKEPKDLGAYIRDYSFSIG